MFSRAAATFGVRRCSAAFSFLAAVQLLVRVFSAHGKRNSAARGELRGHDRFARGAGFYEIVENTVCDSFVERALVPIGCQIKFQGLALDAEMVGHVIDIDPSEIWLACDRANGSEIIGFKMDPVIPAGRWIWKRLEPRLRGRGGNLCVSSSEKREVGCFGFGH